MAKKPKDPASKLAQAPAFDMVQTNVEAKIGDFIPSSTEILALSPASRRVEEMQFVRKEGIEMTFSGGKWYMRDIDLGRNIGLSRPRYIRERIKQMIERKEIGQAECIEVIDDGNVIFFVDQETSTSLAFRSNVAGAEAIAKRMMRTSYLFQGRDEKVSEMPAEKALSGYQRALAYISRKDVPRAAKQAMNPVLEKYARAAGLPVPDVSELLGPETPRLPGL